MNLLFVGGHVNLETRTINPFYRLNETALIYLGSLKPIPAGGMASWVRGYPKVEAIATDRSLPGMAEYPGVKKCHFVKFSERARMAVP